WTIPGNRAISYSKRIDYGIYKVTKAPEGNWAAVGEQYVLAAGLAEHVMSAGKVEGFEKVCDVSFDQLDGALGCRHPLDGRGYEFEVPLLDGDHVTDDTGTGFVHTAPGHGADDYNIWIANQKALRDRGINTDIPWMVDAEGVYTNAAPGFEGKRVLKPDGKKGDANDAVIKALADAGMMVARARLKHSYPHSWRSKKPVIFRNTPQWFIAMDQSLVASSAPPPSPVPADADEGSAGLGHNSGETAWAGADRTLRTQALSEIERVQWVPEVGQNRITGMIENRPDWVVSRQRAWGVPICVFRNPETDQIIPGPQFAKSADLAQRIKDAFESEGADAWFADGAKERFLDGLVDDVDQWEQVRDVLDVWFDSGCTHAFTMGDGEAFPGLQGVQRAGDGGPDRVMYLEGSDQHRGWFHSSLLEAVGTRGYAPYDVVLTHGFVLDEKGLKMSKSLKNVTAPQDVIDKSGADILRLWVAASDYSDDLKIGPEILKTFSETYRKMRNSIRWMLGALAHFDAADRVDVADMPELEKLMLHRLSEIGPEVRTAYDAYDYRKVVSVLAQFLNTDLSAFYFDIRKDALYCDAPSSVRRKAALTVIDETFKCVALWLAPIVSFTAEEAWLARYPEKDADGGSVHLEPFPLISQQWRNEEVAAKWEKVRDVRRVVTGALEIERAEKRMGSSLEAAPEIYVSASDYSEALDGVDLAEVCITSDAKLIWGAPPDGAFSLSDVAGIGVVPKRAEGTKCARSWRIVTDVGTDADYPDISARDAAAMREI
ncbi:MAG: class I tRNA ligase family protein, partial [Pseudomonadota bacterium]